MDPLAKPKNADPACEEDDFLGGYSAAELEELLREGEESGLSERSLVEIFSELFEKHFGIKPTFEERSFDPSSPRGP